MTVHGHNNNLGTGWIDVSLPLWPGMVVFRHELKLEIERRHAFERGDHSNNSRLHIGIHTGTHLDAPRHCIADGKSIDQMPLDDAIGPALVIEIIDKEAVKLDEIKQHKIERGSRIIFKTNNSQRISKAATFIEDFVYITAGAAEFLVQSGVRLVGIDYLSVGGSPETHRILLGAGIWLLEGLDLSLVNPGNYNLVCLPLKLLQVEGSPVRAVLQPSG